VEHWIGSTDTAWSQQPFLIPWTRQPTGQLVVVVVVVRMGPFEVGNGSSMPMGTADTVGKDKTLSLFVVMRSFAQYKKCQALPSW
jgi:hypothetical protein